MTNTCRSEANHLKLFVFLTICGSKLNIYSTLMPFTMNKNLINNLKMANIRFDICFKVKYFALEPSFICFAYYSTKVTEVYDSPRRPISKQDPALPIFATVKIRFWTLPSSFLLVRCGHCCLFKIYKSLEWMLLWCRSFAFFLKLGYFF